MWLIVAAVVLVLAWMVHEHRLVGAVWRGDPVDVQGRRFERSFSAAPFPLSVLYRRSREQLSLPIRHATLAFELMHEHPVHRWLKRWDMAREWQSGDAAFDAAVYVMADQPGIAGEICRPQSLRKALMDLLALPQLHSVHARDGRVWLETHYLPLNRDAPAPVDAGRALRLAAVAEALDAAAIAAADRPRERSLLAVALLAGLSAALVSTGGLELLAAFYLRLRAWAPVAWSLWPQAAILTTVVSALLLALTLLLLRHRSRLPKALSALLFLGIPGIAMNSLFWVSDANREFDRGPAEHRAATVRELERVTRRGKHGSSTFCRVRLSDVREQTWDLGADERWCTRLREGGPAVVSIRPGWLGVSWLDGYDLQPGQREADAAVRPGDRSPPLQP